MSLFGPPDVQKMKAKRDVKGLIKALSYEKDASVRLRAAEALGAIGDALAVIPLIAALDDGNLDVRANAAWALGVINDIRAVEPLIAAFEGGDQNVIRATADALGQIGDSRAIEPLVTVLKDSDKDVRTAAAGALEQIGTPAVPLLIAALKDSDVRTAAAGVLGQIGTPAIPLLIDALKDSNFYVRIEAAGALDKIGWQPAQDESGARYWIEKDKWDQCIRIGSPAIAPLIASFKSASNTHAVDALSKIGELAVEPLIAALRDSNHDVRQWAAFTLGKIGDGRAVEPLIIALKDSISSVRQFAASALGKLGDARAVEPLITTLKDEHTIVRKDAVEALGMIGTLLEDPALRARTIKPLIATFTDSEYSVRLAAVDALDKIDWQPAQDEIGAVYWIVQRKWDKCIEIGAAAVVPLIAALKEFKESDHIVHQAAINALAKIGEPAVEPLIAAFKASDRNVSWAAADALGQIGDSRAIAPLISALNNSDENMCKLVVDTLVRLGQRGVEPLTVALKNSNFNVRKAAAEALDRIGWQPAQDESGAHYWIEKGEWAQCIKIGGPAIEPLIAAFTSNYSKAIETLTLIGGAAVEPLIAAIKDSNHDVRRGAAATLERIYQAGKIDESQKQSILAQRQQPRFTSNYRHSDDDPRPSPETCEHYTY